MALWRLVMREGVEAASIRRVAAEAGCSSGSLRHYFETQGDLLAFAMALVTRRAAGRIAALPAGGDARARAGRVLREVLPLDDERRAEMQVWLAFTMQAVVEPRLRPLLEEAHAALRGLCEGLARELGSDGGERLHAFVDGLALHAVVVPDVTTPERIGELLDAELGRLAAGGRLRRRRRSAGAR
jgi:DNA-binding transcriptional regulator YbjK